MALNCKYPVVGLHPDGMGILCCDCPDTTTPGSECCRCTTLGCKFPEPGGTLGADLVFPPDGGDFTVGISENICYGGSYNLTFTTPNVGPAEPSVSLQLYNAVASWTNTGGADVVTGTGTDTLGLTWNVDSLGQSYQIGFSVSPPDLPIPGTCIGHLGPIVPNPCGQNDLPLAVKMQGGVTATDGAITIEWYQWPCGVCNVGCVDNTWAPWNGGDRTDDRENDLAETGTLRIRSEWGPQDVCLGDRVTHVTTLTTFVDPPSTHEESYFIEQPTYINGETGWVLITCDRMFDFDYGPFPNGDPFTITCVWEYRPDLQTIGNPTCNTNPPCLMGAGLRGGKNSDPPEWDSSFSYRGVCF